MCGAYQACSVCQPGPPKLLCRFCLAPIQDTHWHPHSCVCHTWHSVQNEDATIIRIYLHPHTCMSSAGMTRAQQHYMFLKTPAVTDVCHRHKIFILSVFQLCLSCPTWPLLFWGHFKLCDIFGCKPQETALSTTRTLRNNHRHTCIHTYKSIPFRLVH